MNLSSPIFVAGADTLIGRAIVRELQRQGCRRIVGAEGDAPDLANLAAVDSFFTRAKPEYVFAAAGKSGGISANQKYPADFLLNNLLVESHVIDSAYRHGVKKLLYLASSCVYPKDCAQPMRPDALLTGPLEPTSEAYAVAKIAGIKLCQAYRQQHGAHFISVIPADVFGPGSHFSAEDSHVVPALIVKMHEAKQRGHERIEIWGTGNPRREFTFADDLADACLLLMREYDSAEPINVGAGETVSIFEIASQIQEVVGYRGQLHFDTSKPDGAPIKLLDSTPLRRLGWLPRTTLRGALTQTYESFLQTRQHPEAVHAR